MSYARLWERLLDSLDTWASAQEVAPGRIEVSVPSAEGPSRTVQLVMSRDEWDDLVTVICGDFDVAAERVRRSLLAMPPEQPYLVYDTYDLVPSSAPTLPEEPDDQRLQELSRARPEGFGRWVVRDDDGGVGDEFRPPPAAPHAGSS